jgi:hypothetical protein
MDFILAQDACFYRFSYNVTACLLGGCWCRGEPAVTAPIYNKIRSAAGRPRLLAARLQPSFHEEEEQGASQRSSYGYLDVLLE